MTLATKLKELLVGDFSMVTVSLSYDKENKLFVSKAIVESFNKKSDLLHETNLFRSVYRLHELDEAKHDTYASLGQLSAIVRHLDNVELNFKVDENI